MIFNTMLNAAGSAAVKGRAPPQLQLGTHPAAAAGQAMCWAHCCLRCAAAAASPVAHTPRSC